MMNEFGQRYACSRPVHPSAFLLHTFVTALVVLLLERAEGGGFVIFDIEQLIQLGDREDFVNLRADVA